MAKPLREDAVVLDAFGLLDLVSSDQSFLGCKQIILIELQA